MSQQAGRSCHLDTWAKVIVNNKWNEHMNVQIMSQLGGPPRSSAIPLAFLLKADLAHAKVVVTEAKHQVSSRPAHTGLSTTYSHCQICDADGSSSSHWRTGGAFTCRISVPHTRTMLLRLVPLLTLLATSAFQHPLPLKRPITMRGASAGTMEGERRHILVLGGSGRVGGSTVRAMRVLGAEQGWNVSITVGGRKEQHFEAAKQRWAQLEGLESVSAFSDVGFAHVDLSDEQGLHRTFSNLQPDLVIHTAGPFQRKKEPEALKAALELGIPYVDVCDDIALAGRSKELHEEAVRKGLPMLISTGVWPGVSSLMAVDVISALGGPSETESLDFQFFTAGSGNAGATILSATFLILSEKVLAYVNGKQSFFSPGSDPQRVDFGDQIGLRQVFRMNLMEAYSMNRVFGIPNVATFFGTSPNLWNYLLRGMTLMPKRLLKDRKLMQGLALLSEPAVRVVDKLVGATNAMRIVGQSKDGRTAVALFGHRDLEECVGLGVAAFALQVLKGNVAPGVHFPEEAFTSETTQRVYDVATRGTFLWERPAEAGSTKVEAPEAATDTSGSSDGEL